MQAAEFRAHRELPMLGLLVGATVLLLSIGLPAGERIIPLAAVAAAAIGWTRSFREAWSIGHGWLSYRRWITTRTVDVTELVTIDLVTDIDDRVDAIVFVTTATRLAVPMYELRAHPLFADELRELLHSASSVPGAGHARSLLPAAGS